MPAHSLATSSSTCNLPFQPIHKYTAEVKHRPTIPDNLKYWQIFSQDEQIYHFMDAEGEFHNYNIDTDCRVDQTIDSEIDINVVNINNLDLTKPTKFTQVEIDNLEKVEIEELADDDSDILNLKNNFLFKY